MAQMATLEVQIGMQSSADKVYDIFKRKMYLLPKICPKLIKDVKAIKGDFETVGSVREWKYDTGSSESTLDSIEAIDDGNKSITWNKVGGDILKHYKTFKIIVTVADNNGEGSSVKWTVVYEKQNQNVPEPERYMELASTIIKSVDAYLLKQ